MNANDTSADSQEELTVTFSPALYMQRRAWVFDIMRRERVTQVLDVGCGEGQVVECLCNAAPWLPLRSWLPSSSNEPPELDPISLSQEDELDHDDDFIHIRTLHALDISLDELHRVVEITAPPPPPTEPQVWQGPVRWEPMDVKVWHGGVQAYNPEFVDIECIVSTEVIEHLPPEILPVYAPMLLGVYHPRMLLITTPSYSFNDRFTAPDAPPGTRRGVPDPTGRTARIFRHWDHKFEWTVAEFTEWCEAAAEQWGYEVEISGVGVPREPDPYGRDEQLGSASQVATFKRKEGQAMSEMRLQRCEELEKLVQLAGGESHQLLRSYHHNADPRTRNAAMLEEISDLVLERMVTYQEGRMTIHELWSEHEITLLCGGWLQKLIAAVKVTPGLSLQKTEGKGASDWVVQREGFIPASPKPQGIPEVALHSEPAVGHLWPNSTGDDWGLEDNDEADARGWGTWETDEVWATTGSGGWGEWDTDNKSEALVGVA
ncbi:hypothetical protein BC629DRAFT_1282435 [Irpex lacteus]|nr:hypothetical protein BC629DRAFT_1282435 [Irpex lacteus]